jgi:membrane protein implicated in regulation of membrane protease activity
MKKLLLILITLTTFINVSYASFPVINNIDAEAKTLFFSGGMGISSGVVAFNPFVVILFLIIGGILLWLWWKLIMKFKEKSKKDLNFEGIFAGSILLIGVLTSLVLRTKK